MAIKESGPDKIYRAILYTVLFLFILTTTYPFIYCLVLSFNDGTDALKGGVYIFPRMFTLDNYMKAFQHPMILNSFWITVSRTAIVTTLSVILTALMAYAFSIKGLPGRRYIVFYFFFTTLIGGGLIPTFVLYRQIKILNTYWVLIWPSLFSFYNTIVMKTFFDGIPASLSESARIDGASELRTFAQILLPLSLPVLATISLFVGVGAWNDWFTGAFFIQGKQSLLPASTLLQKIISEASFESTMMASGSNVNQMNEQLTMQRLSGTTPESLRMTFVIIIVFPIICVYPFLQRFFVKGVLVGSLKE